MATADESSSHLDPRGRIFDVQRFSIHDGPGIRTTVFLKGCPLRCVWCHNPEGMEPGRQLCFRVDKCIGCGYCFRVCPGGAHEMADDVHGLDRGRCEVCGSCAEECRSEALEMVGREVGVEEVMAEVRRDKPFYETSSGGMTLSGGEPMQQLDFAKALLAAANQEDVHCCMETCGMASLADFEQVAGEVELFLFDLKETDERKHLEFTGVSNKVVLASLRWLHDQGSKVLLRLPLIPGLNDRDDHFQAVASLVTGLPRLCGVEIMPYHALGKAKRGHLGMSPEEGSPDASSDASALRGWIDRFAALGVEVVNARPE